MAKGSKVSTLDAALQYVKNKLPQTGFFSTLDELIGQAPFEKAPFEQWQNYLKPGRTFEREGVRFPLKQEELDYTFGHPHAQDPHGDIYRSPDTVMTKDELRDWIRELRPDFSLKVGATSPTGAARLKDRFPEEWELGYQNNPDAPLEEVRAVLPRVDTARYGSYAHETESPHSYEESATRSTDFGPTNHADHFGPDVISHSRTTIQPTLVSPNTADMEVNESSGDVRQRMMRLIEEIQSDRHQAAAERVPIEIEQLRAVATPEELENLDEIRGRPGPLGADWDEISEKLKGRIPPQRRGYRTPGLEEDLRRRINELVEQSPNSQSLDSPGYKEFLRKWTPLNEGILREMNAVNDAPFKNPADYGLLELKMQMLNAAKQGQDYLGLVRGKDVSDRFSQDAGEAAGTSHIYDKVYPSVMRKLASQYGAEVRDVPTTLKSSIDVATPSMRDLNQETISDAVRMSRDMADDSSDPDEYINALDHLHGIKEELKDQDPHFAKKVDEHLGTLYKLYDAAVTDPEIATSLGPKMDDAWELLSFNLNQLHLKYAKQKRLAAGSSKENKAFPSMVLSPEVRDRILKAGVPIWGMSGLTAGALAGLGANQEEEGFADGGKVKAVIDAIKRFAPMKAEREEFRAVSGGPNATLKSLRAALEAGQAKRDQLKEGMEETRPDWMGPVDKAEGGEVGGIDRLKQLAENVGTEDTVDRRKRILSGMASQLYGVNPDTNEVELFGGMSLLPKIRSIDEVRDRYKHYAETGEVPQDGGPGLFDEVQSMFLGSDRASEADARLAALKSQIKEKMGIAEPQGFQENFDEALGTMLGQLPVPVSRGKAAIEAATKLEKLKQMLKVAPSAVAEWLTPTVEASPANYLMGATVGGGLGTLADTPPEIERPIKKAEGGSVEAIKPLHATLEMWKSRLSELSSSLPSTPSFGGNLGLQSLDE